MCSAPVGDGAKRTRRSSEGTAARLVVRPALGCPPMLLGAHVSPAGGPARAVDRGVERGVGAIQFFNQSPRAWRAREYGDEEAAEFRETLRASSVEAALIHAVYLINCASRDRTIRRKSLNSLTIA